MSEEIQNNSVKKCCVCNNKRHGEFIIHNEKKYHLCCIEQLQNNWNELKKWLEEEMLEYKKVKYSSEYGYAIGTMSKTLKKMQELEGKNE